MNEINSSELILGASAIFSNAITLFTVWHTHRTEVKKLKCKQQHDFDKDRHNRKMHGIEKVTEILADYSGACTSMAVRMILVQKLESKNHENDFLGEARKQLKLDFDRVFNLQGVITSSNQLRLLNLPDIAIELENWTKQMTTVVAQMSAAYEKGEGTLPSFDAPMSQLSKILAELSKQYVFEKNHHPKF